MLLCGGVLGELRGARVARFHFDCLFVQSTEVDAADDPWEDRAGQCAASLRGSAACRPLGSVAPLVINRDSTQGKPRLRIPMPDTAACRQLA